MSKSFKTAEECGLAYLENRMRTVQEMREQLAKYEFGESEIDRTIKEFIERRYLDDYEYALRYYEYNREKHRGGRRAKQELEKRGIDKETINNAFEDYLYEGKVDEFEDAMGIVNREIEINSPVIDEHFIAKMARRLESRGFEYKDIYRIIDELRRR